MILLSTNQYKGQEQVDNQVKYKYNVVASLSQATGNAVTVLDKIYCRGRLVMYSASAMLFCRGSGRADVTCGVCVGVGTFLRGHESRRKPGASASEILLRRGSG